MIYRNFLGKCVAAAVVMGVLGYYQSVSVARAAVIAENEAAIAEIEQYNREIQIENARRQAAGQEVAYYYQDGTFEGTGTGYGGPVTVAITMECDVITKVEVTKHDAEDPAYFVLAEALTDQIVAGQSLDVDTVSGATFSSKGILEAAENALTAAENKK